MKENNTNMSILYFRNAVDTNWNTVGNWFTDESFSTPAGIIPINGDDVNIGSSPSSEAPDIQTWPIIALNLNSLTFWASDTDFFTYQTITVTNISGGSLVFKGTTTGGDEKIGKSYKCTITSSFSSILISGKHEILAGSTLTGDVELTMYCKYYGDIVGNLITRNNPTFEGTVSGNMECFNNGTFNCTVGGNLVMNTDVGSMSDTIFNVSGNLLMADNTKFQGTVAGYAHLTSTSRNSGTITGVITVIGSGSDTFTANPYLGTAAGYLNEDNDPITELRVSDDSLEQISIRTFNRVTLTNCSTYAQIICDDITFTDSDNYGQLVGESIKVTGRLNLGSVNGTIKLMDKTDITVYYSDVNVNINTIPLNIFGVTIPPSSLINFNDDPVSTLDITNGNNTLEIFDLSNIPTIVIRENGELNGKMDNVILFDAAIMRNARVTSVTSSDSSQVLACIGTTATMNDSTTLGVTITYDDLSGEIISRNVSGFTNVIFTSNNALKASLDQLFGGNAVYPTGSIIFGINSSSLLGLV